MSRLCYASQNLFSVCQNQRAHGYGGLPSATGSTTFGGQSLELMASRGYSHYAAPRHCAVPPAQHSVCNMHVRSQARCGLDISNMIPEGSPLCSKEWDILCATLQGSKITFQSFLLSCCDALGISHAPPMTPMDHILIAGGDNCCLFRRKNAHASP